MKFHTRRRASPVITIVSLIDILTILLIFFIVTTTFKSAQPQVQIVLPATRTGVAKPSATKPALLAIAENGDVYLDDKRVNVDNELGPAVKRLQAEGRSLAMKTDEKAPAGRMFEVLDALKLAGLTDVPALTREKKK